MKTGWLLLSIIVCLLKLTSQSTPPNTTCDSSKQFDCGTGCIPKHWQCDNIEDCQNGADETECERNDCSEGQMLCDNGECVPGAYKCDGHKDCYDESDELSCVSHRLRENSSFNFGDPNHYKHDGGYDKNGCLPGFGLCGIQQLCIPNRSFCDGTTDCSNEREDEQHCPHRVKKDWWWREENPCNEMFQCKKESYWDDQVCINQTELCNGKKECPLGDDESEKCSECSTKHCEYQCKSTPTGAKCVCDKGYRLESDGFSCVEIDECTLPERACDHFCENTIGSFRCSCAKGYHLKDDGKTCELSDTSEGFLLLKEYDEIKRRPLEDFTETNFTTVYKSPEGRFIRSFDYSRRDNKFFMSIANRGVENEKLMVVEHNGTSRVLCENASMKKYEHLAVDWIGNNVFFQEEEVELVEGKISSRNFISVCTMDGRFYRRLIEIEDGRDVRGFAIDPMRGHLFWHDSPHFSGSKKRYPHRIMMANMDGSEVQPLVRSKSRLSKMFAIDHVNHDIYYENEDDDRIRRVKIDSKTTDDVSSNLYFGSDAMAYHNGFLYWTNRFGNLRVQEVARNGVRVHRVLKHSSSQQSSLRLVVNDSLHQLEPSTGNPCAETDCPWICVIVPWFSARCLCPDGYTPSALAHKYQPKFAPCKKGVVKAFDQPHFVVDPVGDFKKQFDCCSTCETLKIKFGPNKYPAKMCCMPELIVTDHTIEPIIVQKVVPPDMDERQYREVNGQETARVGTGSHGWAFIAAAITQIIILAMVISVWHCSKERIALECVPDCDYEYEKEIKVFNPSKSAMMSENMNSDLMSVGAI